MDKKELEHLNRITNTYLDYAEMQAARGRAMTMKDWIEKLALKEYEKYRSIQDKNYVSDFDR